MCGIAGYLTGNNPSPDRSILRAMCSRIEHRGPDGYGEFFDDQAALGHRRLSIIDVAGGSQPLGNEDGSIQVVFNGEIYNFQELQRDLLKRGHTFTTRSDTEVLVHLYEEAGERMPEHLTGMFAFTIWDRRRQTMFLARDRFGEKPLYYSFAMPGLAFCFASELKALTTLPGFDAAVNPKSVADFLCFSYVPDPQSIYNDVLKLQAGHSLTVTQSGHRARRYWAPAFSGSCPSNLDTKVEELKALAADAVERRMISDVPLGAFLSGGIDSSAVVAFMSKKVPDAVKTFSIGFTAKEFDEVYFARIIANLYRTDHHEHIVSPSLDEVFGTLVEHFDEPFADSSAVPMLYLAKMTRKHVTVALSGDGADEVFGGYRRHRHGVLEEQLRKRFPDWFRYSVIRAAGRYYPKLDYLPQVFRAKTLLSNLSQALGDAYFTSMTAFRDARLIEILSPELRRSLDSYSPRREFSARFEAVKHLSPLEQMQAVDYETYLPGDILVKTDRTTMAYSLESRAPWLDHRLAEFACALPPDFKLRGCTGKYIFKKALSSHVPHRILNRKKMGFSVPLAEWFRTSLKPAFEESVLSPGMETYLSLNIARRIWREHQSGLHDHSRKLWALFMLAVWNERHSGHPKGEAVEQLMHLSDAS